MSRLETIGTLERAVDGGRLFGRVGGVDLFIVPRADGTLTVHRAPEVDPGLEVLAREGGAAIVALIRAGYGSVEAGTGDPGLDRLVKEGGGRIIALAPKAPLPLAIGWLRWHRGRRCGRFLAGAIAAMQVLAFREPDGSWVVYRKGPARNAGEPASHQDATQLAEAVGSKHLAEAIRRGATVAMNGEVISGEPSSPDDDGLTAEALSAGLPNAVVVKIVTAAGRKARSAARRLRAEATR